MVTVGSYNHIFIAAFTGNDAENINHIHTSVRPILHLQNRIRMHLPYTPGTTERCRLEGRERVLVITFEWLNTGFVQLTYKKFGRNNTVAGSSFTTFKGITGKKTDNGLG